MRLELLKEIRDLDKKLRDTFKGLMLFKVRFAGLKKKDIESVRSVYFWYKHIMSCDDFKVLLKLWKENTPEWWENTRRFNPNLKEYEKLKYLKLLFVNHCKKTMPKDIVYDHAPKHTKSI